MLLRILLMGSMLTTQTGLLNQEKLLVLYDADSYAVYSAVLNQGLFVDDRDSKRTIIFGETGRENEWEAACSAQKAKRDAGVREIVEVYQRVNQNRYALRPYLELRKPYRLFDISEWNRFYAGAFEKDDVLAGWKHLYELNPGVRGIYSLSAIGFNHEKTMAIVHVSFDCGPLCAQTSTLLVSKVDGKWKSVTDLGCGGVS